MLIFLLLPVQRNLEIDGVWLADAIFVGDRQVDARREQILETLSRGSELLAILQISAVSPLLKAHQGCLEACEDGEATWFYLPSHRKPCRNRPYNMEPQWSQNVSDMNV